MTSTGANLFQCAIAAAGGTVHLVWGDAALHYRRSPDEGATWSASTTIASGEELHLTDPLAAEGSNVYVVYLRNLYTATDWCCPRTIGDVYLRRSTDGGLTWKPEQLLSPGAGAFRLSMAASGARRMPVAADRLA